MLKEITNNPVVIWILFLFGVAVLVYAIACYFRERRKWDKEMDDHKNDSEIRNFKS